ncbi:glycosyltransferase family 4 protein [Terriglobus sp. TAA 43]|uniref:glycosyltransferase family 4 protein n=1 Tax=Terriglobus sp. TAA 43 TaxID=278961 RepID=UPI000646379A|nr:glycosyltransferase family 4 protein [Terriglobus sp. TAA 43]
MVSTNERVRLAYVVSHPIQYQAELLRRIATEPGIDLHVFYCSDFSLRSYKDAGFGVSVEWDIPLTEGYRFTVLPRWRDTHTPSPTRPISRGFFRAFLRGIDGKPFDAVWVHGYSTMNSMHAFLAAKALGIPVLLRTDSWLGERPRTANKLRIKRLFFDALRCMVDGILAVGQRNAVYWKYYFGDEFPVFLMPYAVDNAYFARKTVQATPLRGELQKELGLDPERPVILYASKLIRRKNADQLLEAFLQLRDSTTPRPYLLIVGDGELREMLEQRAVAACATEDVRFTGFRNQSELPRFFDLSTVFVLPARHEAYGLIVNEAMAAGLAVVVSDDVGCADDLVAHGENGYVYPVGNVDALRNALEKVLSSGEAQRMGQRSREIISGWSYAEDLTALKGALRHITGRQAGA